MKQSVAAEYNTRVSEYQANVQPSLLDRDIYKTPQELAVEQQQIDVLNKMVKDKKHLMQHIRDVQEDRELELQKRQEMNLEKDKKLKEMRKSERIKSRKRLEDLQSKMDNAQKVKEQNQTDANKQVWLRKEASRLKQKEIEEDKEFFDNERKAQSLLILQKHEQIQRNLECKHFSAHFFLVRRAKEQKVQKRLEVERKILKQLEHTEKLKQADVEDEIQQKVAAQAAREAKAKQKAKRIALGHDN